MEGFQFIIESPQESQSHKKCPHLVTSCDNCRLKKIKCLQSSPGAQCEACKVANVQCRFRDRERCFAERIRAIAGPSVARSTGRPEYATHDTPNRLENTVREFPVTNAPPPSSQSLQRSSSYSTPQSLGHNNDSRASPLACHHLLRMEMPFSNISEVVAQYLPGYALYRTLRSSDDFEDVKEALNDRTVWSIELFRSCLTIHLNGNYILMLATLSFLVMAETIHVYHGRLPPAELKERVESAGYVAFTVLFVFLDMGFVVVRIAGLVALSGTPGLGAGLVLVSMSPSVVPSLLIYVANLAKRRQRASGGGHDEESGIMPNEKVQD